MAHHKSADPNIFILPDLGEGVHEAELIKWRVAVGQAVNEHDILAEMETDKALVEVPSPRSGVIKQLHGSEGEVLHVGNPLVSYEGASSANIATPATPAPKAAPEPSSNGAAHAEVAEDAGTVVGQMSASAAGVSAAPGKALATPAVRRLARDLGLDIDTLTGTGIGGRVLEKDVRAAASGAKPAPAARAATPAPAARPAPAPLTNAFDAPAPRAAAPAPKPAPSFPAGQDTVRIPFRGVRRTIANRLRESVNRAVHFNVMDEADISSLDSLRKKLGAASGEKLSVLPFVASAVCRVLSRPEFRAMNATVEETDNKEADAFIIQHRAVHIGIATDTDSGLMVPVIRDCDALGVLEIGRQIAAIAGAARSRTIPREQLMGSTFTISNVGSHAGRFATPIINYPEVAILAVGRARHSPVVRHGGLFVGNLLPLSLACDHRVVDGATAALALAEIVKLLQEHPDSLMGPARG
ncbi:MAG: 2-oxo acid dehydrogenase subunit E2 [Phycisphaerales bacterium]|nr:2-oxo acid dehydrogenase subunit E2 [Phycisphaerales bacterium]